MENRLILADALAALADIGPVRFDLLYADPPFFTGRDHRRNGVVRDVWRDGIEAYRAWLRPRLAAMRKALRPTGSLLVHVDWHAAHHVRLLLDELFGADCFQNELIWKYQTGGASRRRFSRKHDNIYWYTRSPNRWKYRGERIRIPRTEKALARARNPKGARISADDRHKNPEDVLRVPQMNPMARERTGYPTQKPEELMRLLIEALTDPGDWVGDFFCGSGTTPAAAERLSRRWVACDSSRRAIEIAGDRLRAAGARFRPDSLAVPLRRPV